jgi:small subunit ribosomal protein S16
VFHQHRFEKTRHPGIASVYSGLSKGSYRVQGVSQTGGTSYNLLQEEVFVLAIRLARIGKKKHPFYRVVVLDKRKPRNGRTVEVVGTYDPLKNPAEIKLDADRIKYWLGCGAQPSDTVRSFLDAQKIA